MTGSGPEAANVEIKCFDQAANPYLATGSVIAAGLAGTLLPILGILRIHPIEAIGLHQ